MEHGLVEHVDAGSVDAEFKHSIKFFVSDKEASDAVPFKRFFLFRERGGEKDGALNVVVFADIDAFIKSDFVEPCVIRSFLWRFLFFIHEW